MLQLNCIQKKIVFRFKGQFGVCSDFEAWKGQGDYRKESKRRFLLQFGRGFQAPRQMAEQGHRQIAHS